MSCLASLQKSSKIVLEADSGLHQDECNLGLGNAQSIAGDERGGSQGASRGGQSVHAESGVYGA